MENTYIIGGVREGERAVAFDVIMPSGEVKRLRMTVRMWESYSVTSGDVVSAEMYREMLSDSERCEVVTKAMSYLTAQSLSYKALSDKLARSGFSEEARETALLAVKKRGLIDEREQAEDLAEKLARTKHRGKNRICAELMKKGYSAEISRAAAESVPSEVYSAALCYAVSKKCAGGIPFERAERDRIIASIVRMGFAPGEVISFFRDTEDYE